MSDHEFNNMSDDDVKISIESTDETCDTSRLSQAEDPEEVQRRTFSHFPSFPPEFIAEMIQAGFYGCNIGDRVMCLKCNLICHQWIPTIDNPCDIHRQLAPHCVYVQAKLMGRRLPPSLLPPPIINTNLSSTVTAATPVTNLLSNIKADILEETTAKLSANSEYAEVFKRVKSFANWSHQYQSSTDDLARAGFFYTGISDTVTCFYCNGSLNNWRSNDNPMMKHAQHFPNCAYIRQLCGEDYYQNIQRGQRLQQSLFRVQKQSLIHWSLLLCFVFRFT